jgi:tetratricopeptide (TPR) repeat protein
VASEALDLWLAEGEYGKAAGMTSVIGRARVMLSQPHVAEPTLRQGIEYGERAGDAHSLGVVYDMLGTVLRHVGRIPEALEATQRALEYHERAENVYDLARSHGHLSFSLGSLGRIAEARHHLEEQLRLARECGSLVIEGNALFNLGGWYFRAGQHEKALDYAERYLELCRQTGDRMGEANASAGFGALADAEGRLADAVSHAERSLQLCRELTFVLGERTALANLSVAAELLGDAERVRQTAREALLMARDTGDPLAILDLRARVARIDAEEGRLREASGVLADVVEERRPMGEPKPLAASLCDLAEVLVRMEDLDDAGAAIDEALALTTAEGFEGARLRAESLSALLPGRSAESALATLAAHGDTIPHFTRMEALHRLWTVTGDRAHLDEARRLLDFAVAHAPESHRESMCERVTLFREILAATKA